jgi:hypothetical protein
MTTSNVFAHGCVLASSGHSILCLAPSPPTPNRLEPRLEAAHLPLSRMQLRKVDIESDHSTSP